MILSFSRCYLCKEKIHSKNSLLCQNCFSRAQKLRWESCARCGLQNCQGCIRLSEFTNVYSIYRYGNIFSEILHLSKNKNDLHAQELFFDLLFIPTRRYLIQLINKNAYTHIILSPLRKERLLHSEWHTNIFYEKILLSLICDFRIKAPFPHLYSSQLLIKSLKQAVIPSQKRKELYYFPNKTPILLKKTYENKDNSSENKIVLLLDDVLTTGNTLISFKKNIDNFVGNSACDILTLFRAPQTLKV